MSIATPEVQAEETDGHGSSSSAEHDMPACHCPVSSGLEVDTLPQGEFAAWDRMIADASAGTFFHRIAWMEAVRESFHHQPFYLVARRGERLVGGLPLFCVRSFIGGRFLVSIPYAVYGGPVGDDPTARQPLLDHAADLAERVGARCIEIRSREASWPGVPVRDGYVSFRRRLPNRAEEVLGWLPRKARAAARSARQKHALTASFGAGHLPAVWNLYCRSMRRLGSLNYPYRFFDELVRRTPGDTLVSLVQYRDRPVAGLVTLLFKGVAMPYVVGADTGYNHLNTNNFIYLTAMERAVELGCHTFDFGRSRIDNTGACAFKKNHGFQPEPLGYQTYTVAGHRPPDLTPGNPRFRLARRLWPMLPQGVTQRLGARLSRHIPG